jgi:ethanolamine ammonia-lyase small subunit
VQIILADGLSAIACMQTGEELVSLLRKECEGRGWRVGTPVCARYARVWLEDEIGQEAGARAAVIILGERPGLGTGDGLSAYLVHEPRIGKTDGDRNMLSNIHQRGTTPEQAAKRMATLLAAMFEQGTSGVQLELTGNPELASTVGGYRAPQVREQLVEKP